MNNFYNYINDQQCWIFNNKVVRRSNFEKENDREIRDVPSPSPIPESTIGKVPHSENRTKNEDNLEFKPNSKYHNTKEILKIQL